MGRAESPRVHENVAALGVGGFLDVLWDDLARDPMPEAWELQHQIVSRLRSIRDVSPSTVSMDVWVEVSQWMLWRRSQTLKSAGDTKLSDDYRAFLVRLAKELDVPLPARVDVF
eukprot:NODE_6391_length_510_cov_246.681319.p2 GENE.NODE_6391_length_510_cov_246.681319~~NODE_6391_length_510_cov_246.681319.p2  ORF type:complete len:114 (+),score=29.93 NODE_6391_length_510_cov_246.681319:3-344(+)